MPIFHSTVANRIAQAAVTPRDEARCIDSFNFEVGNLERIRAASFEDGSTIQQEAQAKSDNFFARVVDPATLRTLPAWTAQFDKLRAAADARLEPCYAVRPVLLMMNQSNTNHFFRLRKS